jgi:hypothetical protein
LRTVSDSVSRAAIEPRKLDTVAIERFERAIRSACNAHIIKLSENDQAILARAVWLSLVND